MVLLAFTAVFIMVGSATVDDVIKIGASAAKTGSLAVATAVQGSVSL
jgi:hypothetical protein